MKISIVLTCYNRQNLLDKTIESINKSVVKDWEMIVVDDASIIPVRVNPDKRIKVIRVSPEIKWHKNPCVPYNIGFRETTGDVILIQNAECVHMGDVLKYVIDNIKSNDYLAFGCYAISPDETNVFQRGTNPAIGNYIYSAKSLNGWYNHSRYRPVAYHFCSAILQQDLNKVGGFDERYARGFAFDDDDFIRTVKCMGLNVKIIDSPFVIHQFHQHIRGENLKIWSPLHAVNEKLYYHGYNPNTPRDYGRNTELFSGVGTEWNQIRQNYDRYYLNFSGDRTPAIPKKIHFIWLGGKLPDRYKWLIDTWEKHHPRWSIRLWTDEDVEPFGLENKLLFDRIQVTGIRSTIFRYEILRRHGGVYVDTDFECLKPLDDLLYLDFFGGGRGLKPILAEGLMGCRPENKLMSDMIIKLQLKASTIKTDIPSALKEICWDFLTDQFLKYITVFDDKAVLFPDSFFYPMPNSFRWEFGNNTPENRIRMSQYLKPSTYCVHLWYTSWLPQEKPKSVVATVEIDKEIEASLRLTPRKQRLLHRQRLLEQKHKRLHG